MTTRIELQSAKRSSRFSRLIGLAYFVVTLAGLAWAKEFLLPVVLAGFISFLLAPLISRLERLGLRPIFAVLGVVALAFVIIGAICATVSVQSLELVNSLPRYRDNCMDQAVEAIVSHSPPSHETPAPAETARSLDYSEL